MEMCWIERKLEEACSWHGVNGVCATSKFASHDSCAAELSPFGIHPNCKEGYLVLTMYIYD